MRPEDLPISEIEQPLRDALTAQKRLVLVAPTGSGKSTQVPQMLLDGGLLGVGQVTVLQPRRLATRMLASWVAQARGVRLGPRWAIGCAWTTLWDFGDGSPFDNTQNPTHTYAAVGTYNVSLTVTSAAGCVSTAVVAPVTVIANPVANFTTNSVCEGLTTQFTDASTGGTSTWAYDFGDGSPINNTQNPTHAYAAAGTYNATLTITMAGCTGTVTLPVTVNPLPQLAYTITPACPTTNVTVNNTSTSNWYHNHLELDNGFGYTRNCCRANTCLFIFNWRNVHRDS